MEKKVFICEDSIEGVFSAIYDAYAEKCNHDDTEIRVHERDNLELFTRYEHTISYDEKARKVTHTILKLLGEDGYLNICRALATEDEEKANAVYHALQMGIHEKNPRILEKLSEEHVSKVFELSRYVNNEILHLKGFLRFQELEKGILYAKIGPRNNILTFLAPHFADRLPGENFMIYDDTRDICVIHPAYKEWFLANGMDRNEAALGRFSEKELEYRELFTFFCKKIGIKERKNIALQRQMCALHFQKYMSEFYENVPIKIDNNLSN